MRRCEHCGGRTNKPGLFGCDDGHHTPTVAQRIAHAIEDDLRDRRSLRQEFESLDDDVQDMIRDAWANVIQRELDKPTN